MFLRINILLLKVNVFIAASVIRMIQKSLKPETFKEAMYLYLDRHKYRTATPNDLWKAFDDAMMKTSDLHCWLNMSNFMSGWTNSRGYPVVSAKSEEHAIILSQVYIKVQYNGTS